MSFYMAIVANFMNHSYLKIQKRIDFAALNENMLINFYQSIEIEYEIRIEAKIFVEKTLCYY